MALCDRLQMQLVNRQADNVRLLEAILHEALAPHIDEPDLPAKQAARV